MFENKVILFFGIHQLFIEMLIPRLKQISNSIVLDYCTETSMPTKSTTTFLLFNILIEKKNYSLEIFSKKKYYFKFLIIHKLRRTFQLPNSFHHLFFFLYFLMWLNILNTISFSTFFSIELNITISAIAGFNTSICLCIWY